VGLGIGEVRLGNTDVIELSLDQAVAAIAARRFSAVEYCDAFIAQSEQNSDLNAFVSWDWEQLRASARKIDERHGAGRLAGIPLALKDNINTIGLATTAGTGALKGFRAVSDAPLAVALFAEGALEGAKANMHELAFGITNNNAVTGATRNPYDKSRIPGGSSGGVAAAVAARMMPAGIGTDTGASVRLPAALCGLVGLRPSVGRYPEGGIVPISHTRDVAGPMTRTVADAALIDAVITKDAGSAEPIRLHGLRIGLPHAHFFEDLEPEVERIVSGVVGELQQAGVTFVRRDLDDVAALDAAVSFPVALYEFMRDLPAYLRESGIDLSMAEVFDGVGSPDVKSIIASQMGTGAMPAEAYAEAINVHRPRLRQTYADYFLSNRVDAVLFPTAPLSARPIGEDETVELNGRRVPTFAIYIRNTDPASNAGIPGISLPAGLTREGLPVGIELDGPFRSDRRLLSIARAIEEAIGFTAAPPSAKAATQ
jgi:indoleacetamide hydrolase